MKKFTFLLLVLFIANLSCKKITGGQPCACSPVIGPGLILTIKNNSGTDLLNPESIGYFDTKQIQVYSKDNNNLIKQISFNINKPFTYTADSKVIYYQLVSYELPFLAKSLDNTFYLKLGNDKIFELNLKVNSSFVERLIIDKKEAVKEYPTAANRPLSEIYTLQAQ